MQKNMCKNKIKFLLQDVVSNWFLLQYGVSKWSLLQYVVSSWSLLAKRNKIKPICIMQYYIKVVFLYRYLKLILTNNILLLLLYIIKFI